MKITENNLEEFLELVAFENRTSMKMLRTKDRTRFLVEARSMAYRILRDNGFTQQYIGDLFNRDHAAVIHSLKKHEYNYNTYNYYQETFDNIRYKMGLDDEGSMVDKQLVEKYQQSLADLHVIIANQKEKIITYKRRIQSIEKTSKLLTQNLKQLCN